MSDMSSPANDGARRVTADTRRKDAAGKNGTPASQGQLGGKTLPPDAGTVVSRKVEQHRQTHAQDVERAVIQLNDYVQASKRDLRFFIDEELGQPVVHVIDSNTHEVIRQIPNEVAMRLARNLNYMNELQELALSQRSVRAGSTRHLGLINTTT